MNAQGIGRPADKPRSITWKPARHQPHGPLVLNRGAFENVRFTLHGEHDLEYFFCRHNLLERHRMKNQALSPG